MENKYFPNLARPLTIGKVTFKNRIFGAPMSNPELDPDCHMRKEDIAFHENRVRGGLASTCIGLGIVDPVGRTHTKEITLYDPMSLPSLKEYANAIHRHNAAAVVELAHGGKYASARSHSDHHQGLILGPNDELNAEGLQVTAMTEEDIERVSDCFANAALLCKSAGIDMVLVHGGHGWLLGQFMSPTMNRRTDRFGGSLENRMRFPLMVIEKIRKACGSDLLIEFRMSGSELIEGGYGIEEGVEMAKVLDGKVDIIHVSAGVHEDNDAFTITHPSMFQDHGVNVRYAAEIKKHVKTPVAALGGLNSPAQMEEIIASGKADIVEVARQSLADPYLPEKAFSGRADEIIGCCRCYTCFFNYLTNRTYCCAFNPVIGSELENRYETPAPVPRKVAVIGGGPGGLMAALKAAKRGHRVDLFEKNDRLGGALLSEKYIPFKQDMWNYIEVLARLAERAGVNIHLNSPMTPEDAEKLHSDVVIAATGAKPVVPDIPGIGKPIVKGLSALHGKEPDLGQKTVILGGGLIGCETGIYLDMCGRDVTIVEMKDDWAKDAYFMHRNAMNMYFRESKVRILTGTRAIEVTDNGLLCENEKGEEIFLEADSILLAAGMEADRALADGFYNTAPRVFQVGDAVKAGKVVDATSTGFWRAMDI